MKTRFKGIRRQFLHTHHRERPLIDTSFSEFFLRRHRYSCASNEPLLVFSTSNQLSFLFLLRNSACRLHGIRVYSSIAIVYFLNLFFRDVFQSRINTTRIGAAPTASGFLYDTPGEHFTPLGVQNRTANQHIVALPIRQLKTK